METVEMDLMQAQIAELTTEVTRLQAKVSKGDNGSIYVVNVDGEMTPISQTEYMIELDEDYNKVTQLIDSGTPCFFNADLQGMSHFILPITVNSYNELGNSKAVYGETLIDYNNNTVIAKIIWYDNHQNYVTLTITSL